MKNPLQTFGPNLLGRDFAIGDMHGMKLAFLNLLEAIEFDPEKDRMFSVGDLVDRGADSQGSLSLIKEPWFKGVLANHEQMMLEAFNGGLMGQYWYQNGGHWGYEAWLAANELKHNRPASVTDEMLEFFDLLKLAEELPFLITVNHKSGKKFHILHAELPVQKELIYDEDLADPEKVRDLATRQAPDGGDAFIWARYVFQPFSQENLNDKEKIARTVAYKKLDKRFHDGLSHIISGHSIVQQPLTILGQTNIDTGAFTMKRSKTGALTCVCLDDWTFTQMTDDGARVVQPVTITRDDLPTQSWESKLTQQELDDLDF